MAGFKESIQLEPSTRETIVEGQATAHRTASDFHLPAAFGVASSKIIALCFVSPEYAFPIFSEYACECPLT